MCPTGLYGQFEPCRFRHHTFAALLHYFLYEDMLLELALGLSYVSLLLNVAVNGTHHCDHTVVALRFRILRCLQIHSNGFWGR